MSNAQMRMIYALEHKAGINNDVLHDLVYGITHKESLSALTLSEANAVIDRLKVLIGHDGCIPDRATQKQQWLIRTIERELGWNTEPNRLRGMIHRIAGVDEVRFLTVRQARTVIETLKDMQKGGRGERRYGRSDV